MARGRRGGVRIIGGRWRGRRVRFPEVVGLRPTPDRARETLFNWLAPVLPGVHVLDLFAGSGILGLEALSRGAASVTAVESHRVAARQLRETARELNATDFEVVVADAMKFLSSTGARKFDVVFVDPPYAVTDYGKLTAAMDSSGMLSPNAWIYLEFTTSQASGFTAPVSWQQHRSSRAGQSTFQLWRRVATG